MSGHNKWSTIRHRKGAQDAKRAKVFSRLAKALIVAAQNGGGDPETNASLKIAIDQARRENMPKDNIERAIKRGTGESTEGRIEEVVYEGYGPGNVAMMVVCATDNTNRTVSEIKNIFTKGGGKFVPSGSVSFQFAHRGHIVVSADDLESAELAAIDAGAEDVRTEDNKLVVLTKATELHAVSEKLRGAGCTVESAQLIYHPEQTVVLGPQHEKQFGTLFDTLEEHDDVQEIFCNAEQTS